VEEEVVVGLDVKREVEEKVVVCLGRMRRRQSRG